MHGITNILEDEILFADFEDSNIETKNNTIGQVNNEKKKKNPNEIIKLEFDTNLKGRLLASPDNLTPHLNILKNLYNIFGCLPKIVVKEFAIANKYDIFRILIFFFIF